MMMKMVIWVHMTSVPVMMMTTTLKHLRGLNPDHDRGVHHLVHLVHHVLHPQGRPGPGQALAPDPGPVARTEDGRGQDLGHQSESHEGQGQDLETGEDHGGRGLKIQKPVKMMVRRRVLVACKVLVSQQDFFF